ncbi:NADH-quinone oxidoreductase subunit H [Aggregicoccus sp. 17bor-14]|uniref:complex I subunit 1/NuoH family protein n=1 Tax=Myxococcaceae TaxID=31 RepID=UPI00129CD7DE|nr:MULTISPECIES: complex I subunit 1 family protein [Myxococcaceae]MBF5041361.1 NADH-quinone oxidoreductase subunit H [Simulacricoccus sp. 17bor-14]MRI87145.1 NADH-quinone oxidoreductase subunit H [Aggregicoccus sp. 17bor-14]
MKRLIGIFTGIAVMLGAIVSIQALAYVVGGLAENLFSGASRLTNIIFLMLVFVMIMATLLTMAERKWSALMQNRIGPNRAKLVVGPINNSLMGLPHILTDSLKMLTKERFRPEGANKFLFNLGPILAFAPVFALFAVVPVGPSVKWDGHVVDMVVATPDFGMLYLLGIASLAVYGTALAGWASNNKFALLGGVRASSQMISYEVALGLSLVGLMVAFSTVQLPAFVGNMANEGAGVATGQARFLWAANANVGLPAWGIFLQPLGFILFFAASFAETKRAPFDSPEGESEIIGYFVEYSGMQFGLFMISEFVEVVVLSGVLTVLFFGGWHLPIYGEALAASSFMQEHGWIYGTILGTVFWLKVLLLIWLQLTIRWTFPRFRYDQIMTLGWKILLPAGLVNLFLSAALVLWDPSLRALAVMGLLEIGFVIALTLTKRETAGAHGGGHGHGAHGDHGHGALDHGHGGHAIAAHGATAHAAHADDHAHAAPAASH